MLLVAPLVGAWIEICLILHQRNLKIVAPLVGAWIEMPSVMMPGTLWNKCRSPRGSVD